MLLSMNVFHQADLAFEREGGSIESVVFNADKNSSSAEGDIKLHPSLKEDPIRMSLSIEASAFVLLPADINICAQRLREAGLDMLIYPELGGESIGYFLSFARLAPVQVTIVPVH